MREYTIFTDSACDIAPEQLKKWGVRCVELQFRFRDGKKEYTNRDLSAKKFYAQMRDGRSAFTSAVNTQMFREAFEPELKAGRDVLYLGFSSGLSSTVTNAQLVAAELTEAYPEREIHAVDTFCASAGLGLLLYMAVQEKENGASLTETARFVLKTAPGLCHWFTVDDLVYLKRGGRLDAASAFVATVLNIKPIMHMDDDGHLINMAKVRGRKAAIRALADKYTALCIAPEEGNYFISHGDCREDAELLEALITEKHGKKAALITDIGPVIGAHSGPGTLALFFVGRQR